MKRYIKSSKQPIVISDLETEIRNALYKIMQEPHFGYPLDEAKEYTFVSAGYDENDDIEVEVRAEVTYDGLVEIMERLNPIVKQYDRYAYFDAVTGGVIKAIIER